MEGCGFGWGVVGCEENSFLFGFSVSSQARLSGLELFLTIFVAFVFHRFMLVPVGSSVKVYSVTTGRVIRVLKRETPSTQTQKKISVVAIQWLPTETSQTFIVYADGTIQLWAVLEGTLRQVCMNQFVK